MNSLSKITLFTSLFALSSVASANIINDGSFEQVSLSPGTYGSYFAGSTLGGWNVVGNPSTDVLLIQTSFPQPGGGISQYNAQSGFNSVDLTGSFGSLTSGVRQTVSTVSGQTYLLSFWVGRAVSSNNNSSLVGPVNVGLQINTLTPTVFTNSATTPAGSVNWQQFSTTFVATGPTTLTFLNGNANNNGYAGLDNVSLEAVPEPATLACLGLGAGLLRARRKSRA